ncbi:MAG: CNNM domain-containing protein [Acidimicrobiales bacterium]
MVIPLLIVLLVGCFIGVALLAVAEVSIIRVRRSAVLAGAPSNQRRSDELIALLDDLPIVLNSILFFVLLLQITSATVGAFLAEQWFGGLGLPLASVGLTLLLFVYAEAIPKTLAVRDPYRMALRVTPMVSVLAASIRPIVATLLRLADLQSPGHGATLGVFTAEEIVSVAQEAAEAGQIDSDDAELVARSFEFNDRLVSEVMVPRDNIVHVSQDSTVTEAMTTAIAAGHRRLPVTGSNIDEIVGTVRLRDLAAQMDQHPDMAVGSLIAPVQRCRPDDLLSTVVNQMQASGSFVVIINDQSRATLGLATIEDIVAELVGEIADE